LLKYKQIWHGIKPTRWLIKINLTMCIEEQRTVAEPVEELEKVILDDAKPERTTRVETLASPPIRQALTTFLREN